METTKYTAVIILNYNNVEDTINCVKSVEEFNTAPIKFVIVDNGSKRADAVSILDDAFKKTFQNRYIRFRESDKVQKLPYVSFIVSETNDGYACGNNKGLRFAKMDDDIDRILILNNDVLFVEDIIPQLCQALVKLPFAGIVSPILYKKDMNGIDYNCARLNQTNWQIIFTYLFLYNNFFGIMSRYLNSQFILKKYQDSLKKEYLKIELPSGSCMLFEKSLMDKIKLFDPQTFLYFEENILYKQLENKGFQNYLLTKLKCIHLGASSTNKVSNTFIVSTGLKSAEYYLKEYGNMTFTQKIFLGIAKRVFMLKLEILDSFHRK